MHNIALVPVPTLGVVDPTKCSPPLDVRSTVSKSSSQDPTIILVAVPSNTSIPHDINTPVEPTESFKTVVSDITKALLFLISPISYETEILILHMEDLKQKLANADSTYKAYVPHPNKSLLLVINDPIKILNVHLQ